MSSSADVAISRQGEIRVGNRPSLICFSHLRWDFVYQRPQHLMSRFARARRVLFWEEPELRDDVVEPALSRRVCETSGVIVCRPQLPSAFTSADQQAALRTMLDTVLAEESGPIVRWYYTPMMLPFSRHIRAACTVYDCMDELANFKFAPPALLELESELLALSDLVFTGGYSLYEAKRSRHPSVHPFPSSVDRAHFLKARQPGAEPADQAAIRGPRVGYVGVIDERLDLSLIAALADARPDLSVAMIGPVVKIAEEDLPRRPNIHYLGMKPYDALPDYIRGWDVALMPFALNDATKFISPTKTPEYLSAGVPVVSTPVTDVVRHYGEIRGVFIARGGEQFVGAVEQAITLRQDSPDWIESVDAALSQNSWDATFRQMDKLIDESLVEQRLPAIITAPARRKVDYLVVGAGFAGSVLAERLASQRDARVLVVDRRPHVGGNAYDKLDAAGVLIHQYGPHIFHTNSDEIFAYLSQFTEWRPYEHRVLAQVRGQLLPIPINRTTINKLFGLNLTTEEEAAAFLASRAEPVAEIRNSRDVVVSAVGRELYELFFEGYTRKQWGIDPSALDKAVTSRVPTRTNTDDRYFGDKHQAMPKDGYTAMFNRMLDHPNIDVLLSTDYPAIAAEIDAAETIYTGPIDEFFDFRFGKLPYRSLRFEHRTMEQENFQPVAVVNYPAPEVPYTRITEYKHLTGQAHPQTSVTYEYPCDDGDPYYPVPRPENQALYKRYEALAKERSDVHFVGRLATYKYYNMDQVVGQALATFRRINERVGRIMVPATAASA
jgi:UDP-galactopyranose mutase